MAESNPRPVVLPPEGVQEFRFTVVKGISPGSVVSFPGGSRTVRIGRSAENDVVIGDPAVSREHARVDLSADAWLLADAGSRTGIEKMGFRIGQEPEPLQSGDEFRLGDTILRFEVVPKRGASRLRKAGTDAEAKEAKRTPWALPGGFGRLGVGNRRRQLLLLTIIVLVLAVGWWPEPVGLPPQGTGALAIDYDEVIGFLQGRGNRLDGAYFEIPDDAEGIGIHFQVASSGEVDVRVGRERIERLTPSRQWREHQLLVLARAVSPEKGKALFVLDNRGYSAKQGDIDPASAREWGVRRMWVSRRPSLPLSLRTIDERLAVIEETASRLAAKPRDIAPIAAGLRETTLGLMKLTGQKVRLLSRHRNREGRGRASAAERHRNGTCRAQRRSSEGRAGDARFLARGRRRSARGFLRTTDASGRGCAKERCRTRRGDFAGRIAPTGTRQVRPTTPHRFGKGRTAERGRARAVSADLRSSRERMMESIPSRFVIRVQDPEGTDPQSFPLREDGLILGKHSECDVVLSDTKVSRRHARIHAQDGTVTIEDLGSTNGTWVNGESISEPRVVSAGEEVRIARFLIRILADESDSTAVREAERNATPEPPSEEEKKARMFWASMESFFGPIWPYIEDASVSEIMVNGPREIFFERKGRLERAPVHFTEEGLRAAILNVAQYVGKRVNEENPYMDARLPDGSRVAVVLPPCSRKGASIAIRKFSKEKLTIADLIRFGSMSEEVVAFVELAVKLRKNVIVSGGTSSGKTSLLNVVSSLIPNDQRILVIEDSAELQLQQEHVLPLEAKPPDKSGRGEVTLRELVRASLRLRPDRIVVGEVRGGEALDLLQAMNTGHSGSMATIHASSPLQTLSRLETLTLFSGLELPILAIREQVSTAVDVIIQAARLQDGSRKVTHVSEVLPLTPDGRYRVQDIYRFVRTGSTDGRIVGEHRAAGALPSFLEELELAGLTLPPSLAEIASRPGAREAVESRVSTH